MIKVLCVLWIISGIISSAVCLWLVWRKSHPLLCRRCKHLLEETFSLTRYRFHCERRLSGFETCPKFCKFFLPIEDGDNNAQTD